MFAFICISRISSFFLPAEGKGESVEINWIPWDRAWLPLRCGNSSSGPGWQEEIFLSFFVPPTVLAVTPLWCPGLHREGRVRGGARRHSKAIWESKVGQWHTRVLWSFEEAELHLGAVSLTVADSTGVCFPQLWRVPAHGCFEYFG